MGKQYVDDPKSANGKFHAALRHGPAYRRLERHQPRAALQGLTPQQIVAIMGGTPGAYSASKANVIAIGELGGGYSSQDVIDYFQSVGLPAPNITWIDVGIPNGGAGGDAAPEVSLDYQWSGGIFSALTGAPATIRIYGGNDFTPIMQAILKDIQSGIPIVSVSWSWGADEASSGASYCKETDIAGFEPIRALGVPVGSAAGDNDYTDGGAGANVDYPASGPHGIACGGVSYINGQMTVWNSGAGEGTGGGYSSVFPFVAASQPTAPLGAGRMVSDLAGLADPANPGIANLTDGEWSPIGGTSAVGPMMAGIWAAILQKPVPTLDPQQVSWNNPGCFTPVTSGTNGKYPGAVCCGLGTPWIDKLAAVLGNSQAPATPAPLGPIPSGGGGGGGGTTGTGGTGGGSTGSTGTTGIGSGGCGSTGTTSGSGGTGSTGTGTTGGTCDGAEARPRGMMVGRGSVRIRTNKPRNEQIREAARLQKRLSTFLVRVLHTNRRTRRLIRRAMKRERLAGGTGLSILSAIIAAILPIILNGLANGQTFQQLLPTIIAAIIGVLGGGLSVKKKQSDRR